jgi:hypothetical protein
MNLNISYDAATQGSAPSAFFGAVNYVVGLFDATFTNNATINIEIGYGTFPSDGSTVPSCAAEITKTCAVAAGASGVFSAMPQGSRTGRRLS